MYGVFDGDRRMGDCMNKIIGFLTEEGVSITFTQSEEGKYEFRGLLVSNNHEDFVRLSEEDLTSLRDTIYSIQRHS